MSDREPGFNRRPQRNWNREAYYSWALEEVHGAPWWATREGQGWMQAESEAGHVHMPLLECSSGVLWGSWAKAGLANSNQKRWDFGKLFRGLIKELHKVKVLEGRRDCLSQGGWGSHTRNFRLLVTLGCHLGHALSRGLMSIQVPAGHLAAVWMPRWQY